jgi:hypothetical protein
MPYTVLYGASDDCIELEGNINEEFYASTNAADDEGDLLTFSCGLVARILFTREGVWRINVLRADLDVEYTLTPCPADDEDNYTDRLEIHSLVRWAVFGNSIVNNF